MPDRMPQRGCDARLPLVQSLRKDRRHQSAKAGGGFVHAWDGRVGFFNLRKSRKLLLDRGIQRGIILFRPFVRTVKKGLCQYGTQFFHPSFIGFVVAYLVVGEQGRGVRTVGKGGGVYHAFAATEGVDDAPLFLYAVFFSEQRHARSGKKDEIVAQRESGALPRAFAHMLAQAAIERTVALIFAHAQFLRIDTDVSKHILTSRYQSHYILTYLFQKCKYLQRLLKNSTTLFMIHS